MKKLLPLLFLAFVLLAGCPDAPLYETPLPNGYVHRSNGESFGIIRAPGAQSMIQPLGMQDNGEEWWCDEFAWQGQWVVCQIKEESGKFPPRPPEYLVVDTSTNQIIRYKDREQVKNAWKGLTRTTLPQLKSAYPSRHRR